MIRYADFKEVKVRYTDEGEGRVVVLLHGFMESLDMWSAFSKKLSQSYRVICIDLPGFGETPSIGYIHTMELMAKCVKGVMDNLRLRRYVIVGHSMGGYVGLAFTELFRDNVSGLCLFHSSAAADSDEKKASRDSAVSIVKKKPRQYVKVFFEPLFASQNVEQFKDDIERFRERADNWTARSIVNSLEGMKVRDNREWMLQMSGIPVGFIIGKYDAAIPYEPVLKQSEAIKRKRVLFLENAGHMGFLEAKEETLKFVKRFARAVFRKKI